MTEAPTTPPHCEYCESHLVSFDLYDEFPLTVAESSAQLMVTWVHGLQMPEGGPDYCGPMLQITGDATVIEWAINRLSDEIHHIAWCASPPPKDGIEFDALVVNHTGNVFRICDVYFDAAANQFASQTDADRITLQAPTIQITHWTRIAPNHMPKDADQ